MYDLVRYVEIVFGLCKLLCKLSTAFENYVWNMRDARKTVQFLGIIHILDEISRQCKQNIIPKYSLQIVHNSYT